MKPSLFFKCRNTALTTKKEKNRHKKRIVSSAVFSDFPSEFRLDNFPKKQKLLPKERKVIQHINCFIR